MPDDDWQDDEDWSDDAVEDLDDEPDEQEAARCPECGAPVHIVTDKCPACGYWLSEADRQAMGSDSSISGRLKLATRILLVVLLIFLLLGGLAML